MPVPLTPPWARLLTRTPVLRRLWTGALLSAFGDRLTGIALIWYVMGHTGDGGQVGTLLLCFALPAGLTSGPIGKLLDRMQPRTLMVADNLLRAGIIALAPLLDGFGLLSFPLLCGIAALCGALLPATRIGTNLVVRRLADDQDRADANAAFAFTEQAATVVGPALAGWIVAHWGATRGMWIDALSFLAMAWALLAVPDLPRHTVEDAPHPHALPPWRELLRPAILAVTCLSGLFYFSYGPTEASLPLFVRGPLRSDAQGMGILWSAVGIGATIGSLATGWLGRRGRTGVILAAIMVSWGLCEAALAQSTGLWHAALAFLAGGIAWGPYIALKTTLMQRLVPEARLGAVQGLQDALLTPTAPLGTALGGLLLRIAAPEAILLGSGLACIVGGALALLVPALRHADHPTTESFR